VAPPAAETLRAAAPAARPEPVKAEPAHPAAPVKRNYESLIREGNKLIEGGKTKRAMALFEEATKLRPDGVAALTGMGYGWLDRGDAKRAASMFQQAMLKDGHYAPALFGLGEAYREMGRKGEALTAFRLYLSRFPSSREASAARRQIEQLGGK
jgi:tetratricopeptide (TPR) repeat protein